MTGRMTGASKSHGYARSMFIYFILCFKSCDSGINGGRVLPRAKASPPSATP